MENTNNKEENKVRCFVCSRRVELHEIVVMSINADDMVCVCREHVKFRMANMNEPSEHQSAVSASA